MGGRGSSGEPRQQHRASVLPLPSLGEMAKLLRLLDHSEHGCW